MQELKENWQVPFVIIILIWAFWATSRSDYTGDSFTGDLPVYSQGVEE